MQVMIQRQNRHASISLYLAIVAVVDRSCKRFVIHFIITQICGKTYHELSLMDFPLFNLNYNFTDRKRSVCLFPGVGGGGGVMLLPVCYHAYSRSVCLQGGSARGSICRGICLQGESACRRICLQGGSVSREVCLKRESPPGGSGYPMLLTSSGGHPSG